MYNIACVKCKTHRSDGRDRASAQVAVSSQISIVAGPAIQRPAADRRTTGSTPPQGGLLVRTGRWRSRAGVQARRLKDGCVQLTQCDLDVSLGARTMQKLLLAFIVVLLLPTFVVAQQSSHKPTKQKLSALRPTKTTPCERYGAGFVRVGNTTTCMKIGGGVGTR